MALLFMDGFDVGDYAQKGWNSAATTVPTGTVSGRFGGLAFMKDLTSQATGGDAYHRKLFPASAQITIGLALYPAAYNSGSWQLSLWTDSGASQQLTLDANPSTRIIELRRGNSGGTIIASSSTISTLGAWAYLEIQATISSTVGTCTVRLNGSSTPIISFSGNTKNGGTSSNIDAVSLGAWQSGIGNAGGKFYFDDLYVCDGTGSAPYNTFLGDVRIASLSPNGAGSSTQLTPDSGSNYARVNEVPYSASNYVQGTSSGLRDTYALADLPAGTASVFAVQNNIVAKKAGSGTMNVKPTLNSASAISYGTTTTVGSSDATISDLRTVDPATSAAWTVGGVNALEAGMEIA